MFLPLQSVKLLFWMVFLSFLSLALHFFFLYNIKWHMLNFIKISLPLVLAYHPFLNLTFEDFIFVYLIFDSALGY